jgi:hypothetical protein
MLRDDEFFFFLFSIKNPEDLLRGIFVHRKAEGQTWISGSVDWAKAGRYFKLETCPKLENEKDCYIWKETDPNHR